MIDEALVAVTRDRATELAGLSVRQVDYWSSTDLIKPTVCQRLTPHRQVRLYGFLDLMALMVAAELPKRGVSLQHIRTIVAHLRERGHETPLGDAPPNDPPAGRLAPRARSSSAPCSFRPRTPSSFRVVQCRPRSAG
jgi:DNA-binding transcriptional MerR regulator